MSPRAAQHRPVSHEKDIKHENAPFWVGDTRRAYVVYGPQHSIDPSSVSAPDSSYAHNADGLSIAIARCDYLARRRLETQENEREHYKAGLAEHNEVRGCERCDGEGDHLDTEPCDLAPEEP